MKTGSLGFSCLWIALLASSGRLLGDDSETLKHLEQKGAKVSPAAQGAVSVSVNDCSTWTEDDYKALGAASRVTHLSLGKGFAESSLPWLKGLVDLEVVSTNVMQVTDEGVKAFAQFPKLQRLAFFHPPKAFTGAGLADLAEMHSLEELTVAGSFDVGDDALLAISKIKSLKRVRIWHAGNTNEGVRHLKELPALESLTLGQRLTNTPPACPDAETIASLLEIETLKSLALWEARLDYDTLAQLKQLPRLTQLTLDGVDISNADVERLKKEMPSVAITMTKPTDVYMKRIDQLFNK